MVALKAKAEIKPEEKFGICAILREARKCRNLSLRKFASFLNAEYGGDVASYSSIRRLEEEGPGDDSRLKRLVALIAPYTPYSSHQLFAIASGDIVLPGADMLDGAGTTKLSVTRYKTVVAGLLAHVLEIEQISSQEFADRYGLTEDRVKAILEAAQPTDEEYKVIAQVLNSSPDLNWSAEMLRSAWREPSTDGET